MIAVETTLSAEEAFSRVKHIINEDELKILDSAEPTSIKAKQGSLSSWRTSDSPKDILINFQESRMGSNIVIRSKIRPLVDFLFISLGVTVLSFNIILNILSIALFGSVEAVTQTSVVWTSILGIGLFLIALIDLGITHLKVDTYARGIVEKLSPWII
ncbi:MAG: hypothetical protein ACE5KG_06760 [Nitrososphaerales archaeon]